MPSMINHGGGCCGIRHIAGFGAAVRPGEQDSFNAALRAVPIGRLAEVTLIDAQQQWIPELERNGFVKTLRFRNNNTGNMVTVLHRHQNAGALPNEFEVFGADGIPVRVPDAPAVAAGPVQEGGFEIGSRVRYEYPGSSRNNQIAIVEQADRGSRRIRWDRDGQLSGWLVVGNLRTLDAPVAPAPARRLTAGDQVRHIGFEREHVEAHPEYGVGEVIEDRNQNAVRVRWPDRERSHYAGSLERVEAVEPAPEPARPEVREVAAFYHCVYRDNRRGAGYDTLEAARAANPRARRIDQQTIMSDGGRIWLEGLIG